MRVVTPLVPFRERSSALPILECYRSHHIRECTVLALFNNSLSCRYSLRHASDAERYVVLARPAAAIYLHWYICCLCYSLLLIPFLPLLTVS